MITMDKITEEIAHFIGMLQMNAEQALVRHAYEEFDARKSADPEPDERAPDDVPFEAPYEFLGFDPGVPYRSPGPGPMDGDPHRFPNLLPPPPPLVPDFPEFSVTPMVRIQDAVASGAAAAAGPPELEPPGSVVTYITQAIGLSDNDDFSIGGHGLSFSPAVVDTDELLDAAEAAYALSPIGGMERPGSSAEMIETVNAIAARLEGFAAGNGSEFEVVVQQGEGIEGIFVNGELVEELPKLADYHEFEKPEEEGETAGTGPITWTGNATIGEDGSIVVEASVTLTAGDNTLVNEAIVKTFWTAGTVAAVVGNHIELNAIIQTNAIWDADKVGSDIGDWASDPAINDVLNIASFGRTDLADDNGKADATEGGFPDFWAVTKIEGDLLMVNWLEQFIFKSDNDVGILSSSGVTTSVISGGNTGVNQSSVFDLGFSYDLIVIGGSIYDASIIQQTNILFDDDLVGSVNGFQTKGTGTASTSGNLLWNEAAIHNIGGADRFSVLPDAYRETAEDLADGKNTISKGVLTDEAFAGLAGLNVLYIEGDVVNLQYIKQNSVLGDCDQVALAMDELKPHLDGDWSVSTGGNALINNAAIVNLDSFGKTYVGGEKYSQETLIQAELISCEPDRLFAQDPNMLVNEAIAFLDNPMAEADQQAAHGVYVPSANDGPTDDGLQHVLGH